MGQFNNINTQKIDGTTFETYKKIIAIILVIDQASKVKFFEKTFLVANVSPNVVFKIPFFILTGVDVNFLKKKL